MKNFLLINLLFLIQQNKTAAQLIASETFNYATGSIVGKNGGTGWGTPWQTTPFNTANSSVVSPGLSTSTVNGTGNTDHQVGNDQRNFRMMDTSNAAFFPYMDFAGDPGAGAGSNYLFGRAFGKDNTTIWFGMLMRKTSAASTLGYGGMHLMYGYDLNFDQYGNKMAHQRLQFGTDNNASNHYIISRTINGNPNLAGCSNTQYSTVAATAAADLLVYRIDFKPGAERIFMWVNPISACAVPDTTTADVITNVCDFRFNAVNIGSGSSSGTVQYDLDEFRIGLSYTDVIQCGTVPLNFINVAAITKHNQALISWQVTGEENITVYEIEKSVDGINYFSLATINKTQNNPDINSYSYTDNGLSVKQYYRIKAHTMSGRPVFSAIVAINKKLADDVSVFPNPANDKIKITGCPGCYAIKIFDATGRLLTEQRRNTVITEVPVSNLLPGIYHIKLISKAGYRETNFIKQ